MEKQEELVEVEEQRPCKSTWLHSGCGTSSSSCDSSTVGRAGEWEGGGLKKEKEKCRLARDDKSRSLRKEMTTYKLKIYSILFLKLEKWLKNETLKKNHAPTNEKNQPHINI